MLINISLYQKKDQNTIVIYFGRLIGNFWNMMLVVDCLENKEESLINKFPEFTSYVNSITIGRSNNL